MINEEKLKIQREAIEALRLNSFTGIVILPTGTGKTYVLIEALKELYEKGMRVLYTCDSTRLRDNDFVEELKKWGASEYIDVIERQCYASAYKKNGDVLLADEGDYALSPEYSKLFFNNKFKHIIFVTATLDTKKVSLAKKIAPVVYHKKLKEIEERKVVNKCQFVYVPFRLNDRENKRYVSYNKTFRNLLVQDRTSYITKQLENLQIQRQHFLAGLESSAYICKKLINELHTGSKILIFCGLTEQADKICKWSYHAENEENENLDKFEKGEIPALAVCGKVNRGVNLTGVNTVIIESPKRSETLMVQRTGRGRRLDVDEILYVYLLIPYFQPEFGGVRATIVLDWVKDAAKEMGIEEAKTHIVK